jgi:hypothetical protein
MTNWGELSPDVPLDKPNPARMYDYLLGGSHNLASDRHAAEQLTALYPETPLVARANRAFLHRAVRFLVAQGLTQFLDIGSGIPTVGNVHEIAHRHNPAARVVYVDRDPIAVELSTRLLRDDPRTIIVQADARQADELLHHPAVQQHLDFRQPLGLLLVGMLYFVTDDGEALRLVHTLCAALAAGSYLALSHPTHEVTVEGIGSSAALQQEAEGIYAQSTSPLKTRSRAQIAAYFAGLELVAPGLVYLPAWRPEDPQAPFQGQPERAAFLAGVARKPEHRMK